MLADDHDSMAVQEEPEVDVSISDVRTLQSSITSEVKDGLSLKTLTDQLKNGKVQPMRDSFLILDEWPNV